MNELNKTEIGLDENITGAIAYLVGFLTGVLLLLIEKDNKFVKFHSIQSIVTFFPLFIIGSILVTFSPTPYIGWMFGILNSVLLLADFVLWILLMFKAYQHETFKLPIVGDIAERYVNR